MPEAWNTLDGIKQLPILHNSQKWKITYKRKLVKRKNKDDLKQFLVNFYKSQYLDQSRKNTKLREPYKEWMIYRRDETAAKSGTIRKNKMEWNKFYENSVLADMKITDIKPIDLIRLFRKLTKDRTYTRKCVTNIRSLLSGIFSYAVEEEIITHNPILDVDLKKFSYKPVENQSDNAFTRDEVNLCLMADLSTPNVSISI